MKGQVTVIWVLIIASNKAKLIKCVVAVNGKHLCLQDISSQQVGPLAFLFKSTDAREPLSAGVQEGRFSLIIATSSNVNSQVHELKRELMAGLWSMAMGQVLLPPVRGGCSWYPGWENTRTGPLDTTVLSKEIHHQGEIQDTKIEELCMPSAHKEIPAFMWMDFEQVLQQNLVANLMVVEILCEWHVPWHEVANGLQIYLFNFLLGYKG